jgi:uncharacterized protein YndB with AHSA1/START domain
LRTIGKRGNRGSIASVRRSSAAAPSGRRRKEGANMTDKTATPVATNQTLVVERTYRADVRELWDLWTTGAGFASWWGPEGFRVEVQTMEARLDGAIRYNMIADTPEMVAAMKQMGRPITHAASARFSEFQPFTRLAVTTVVDFVPGVPSYDSTMTVDFVPSGDRVRMAVTLSPMHDEQMTRMSVMGFTSQISKLDRRFPA